jgi:hypothetical protein
VVVVLPSSDIVDRRLLKTAMQNKVGAPFAFFS